MILISAQFVRRVVAKLCLRVWAWRFFKIPALIPYVFIMLVMKNLVSRTCVSSNSEDFIFSREKLCRMNSGEK